MISILPARPCEWNSSASASENLTLLPSLIGRPPFVVSPARPGLCRIATVRQALALCGLCPMRRSASLFHPLGSPSYGRPPSDRLRSNPDDGAISRLESGGGRLPALLPD